MITVAAAKTNSCPLATISAPSQQHRSTLSLRLSATNTPTFTSHWFLFPLTAVAPAAMQRSINSTHAVITSTVSSPCFLLTVQLHAVGAHVAKFEAIIHCLVCWVKKEVLISPTIREWDKWSQIDHGEEKESCFHVANHFLSPFLAWQRWSRLIQRWREFVCGVHLESFDSKLISISAVPPIYMNRDATHTGECGAMRIAAAAQHRATERSAAQHSASHLLFLGFISPNFLDIFSLFWSLAVVFVVQWQRLFFSSLIHAISEFEKWQQRWIIAMKLNSNKISSSTSFNHKKICVNNAQKQIRWFLWTRIVYTNEYANVLLHIAMLIQKMRHQSFSCDDQIFRHSTCKL